MLRKVKMKSGIILAFLMIVFMSVSTIKADENKAESANPNSPFVIVNSYEVTDGFIAPGKQFDLVFEIENTNKQISAKEVLVTVNCPEGINVVYPTINQVYIGNLKPGERKQITFNFNAVGNYARPTAAFGVSIVTEERTNNVTLYAPVNLDNSSFKLISKAIPKEAGAGERISASFAFKSLMNYNLSDVALRVFVDEDDSPAAIANIGNISAGASKNQNVTFSIDEEGIHSIKFVLNYNTSAGEISSVEIYSGTIQILDSLVEPVIEIDNHTGINNLSTRQIIIIGGCLGLSLILAVGIVIIAKKCN